MSQFLSATLGAVIGAGLTYYLITQSQEDTFVISNADHDVNSGKVTKEFAPASSDPQAEESTENPVANS